MITGNRLMYGSPSPDRTSCQDNNKRVGRWAWDLVHSNATHLKSKRIVSEEALESSEAIVNERAVIQLTQDKEPTNRPERTDNQTENRDNQSPTENTHCDLSFAWNA